MHLRPLLVLAVLSGSIAVVVGCRRPLAPTFDRNLPPETWITAAPFDTITYRDGSTPHQTLPGYIPFRYHLYWAGSDPDGKVVGFYFAVVETLPVPVPPAQDPPPLPGPKASDYRYTTRTDSVFTFDVSDQRRDRRHAFYLYAVDNQGKADPTPARFIFNSLDRFPPIPVIDKFIATGFVWLQDPVSLALRRVIRSDTVTSRDTFTMGAVPHRTVPSGSRLDIAWHSEATTVDNEAVSYRYKLDEPEFVEVGATTTTLSYNTGPGDAVGPGTKIFTLRAIDRAGGAGETTRFFQMNLPPTTWFAGAEPSASLWQHAGGETFVPVTSWRTGIPDLTGVSLLSGDSLRILPSQRTPRRNFLEFYGNRIYLRREYETVHMNSWIVFFNGGFDPDSPYNVALSVNDPLLPQIPDSIAGTTVADTASYPVLQVRPANGSPIGFRSRVPVFVTPLGPLTRPSQTGLYPIFDPASVYRAPMIGSYWGMSQAGQAYLYARAEDGNGQPDDRIGKGPELDPRAIVYAVDSTGSATPEQIALRPLIITFFVDQSPQLSITSAQFAPKPGPTVYSRTGLPISMVATDTDPYDPGNLPAGVGGGSSTSLFRYTIRFRGQRNGGAPGDSVTFAPPALDRTPGNLLPATIAVPDSLGGTSLRVMIQLCDCDLCETVPGSGRCIDASYLINVQAPPAAAAIGSVEAVLGPNREGRKSPDRP